VAHVTRRRPGGSPARRSTWPVNLPGTAPAGTAAGEDKPEQENLAANKVGRAVAVGGGMAKNNERYQ
jgi:hypothetical protein